MDTSDPTREPRPVALLFPGQGSQYAGMAAGLYGVDPVFTSTMDTVLDLMGDPSLKPDWLSGAGDIPIDDVRRAGGMLAVAGTEERVRPYLIGKVAVAAVNAARQVMLAGPEDELRYVDNMLRSDDFIVAVVPATSPFHCPAMAPAAIAVLPTVRDPIAAGGPETVLTVAARLWTEGHPLDLNALTPLYTAR